MTLSKQTRRKQQRGIAMIMALLALLLLAIIGASFMMMNTTETSANQNYKDSQRAYFASRAGLENVRALLITTLNANAKTLTMPTTSGPTGAIYVINPTNSEAIDPRNTPYLDDELCQEQYVDFNTNLPLLAAGTPGAPCGTGSAAELTSANYFQVAAAGSGTGIIPLNAGDIPNTNSASALPFKWVRITNKQNLMGLVNGGQRVDTAQANGQQVCWDGQQEFVTAPGNCPNLSDVSATTMNPVWLLTSLAVTPTGSRRMTQMEVAFTPPPNVNATVSTKAPITLRGNLQVDGTDFCTCLPNGLPRPPALACDRTRNAIFSGVPFPGVGITQMGGPSETLTGVGGVIAPPTVYDGSGNVVTAGSTAQGKWPYNIGQLVNEYKSGAQSATGPPWNFTCAPPSGSGQFPTCSGGSGLPFGVYPSQNYPNSLGGGPIPSTGTPAIVYVPGSVRLTGNTTGDGVLIVDGDLDVHGGMAFYGLILVTGRITFTGGGSEPVNLYGAILAGQDAGLVDTIGGSFNFRFDSCALKQKQPPGPPKLIATHELMY